MSKEASELCNEKVIVEITVMNSYNYCSGNWEIFLIFQVKFFMLHVIKFWMHFNNPNIIYYNN